MFLTQQLNAFLQLQVRYKTWDKIKDQRSKHVAVRPLSETWVL